MLKAKAERIYTIEFTVFDDEEIDYDKVHIPNHEDWIARQAKHWIEKGYPNADHIVVKVQTFLHEPSGKTYMQDLLEKFPDAGMEEDENCPKACRDNLYPKAMGKSTGHCRQGCTACWNTVMPKGGEDDEG